MQGYGLTQDFSDIPGLNGKTRSFPSGQVQSGYGG
jgi:hypothetical protein